MENHLGSMSISMDSASFLAIPPTIGRGIMVITEGRCILEGTGGDIVCCPHLSVVNLDGMGTIMKKEGIICTPAKVMVSITTRIGTVMDSGN